MVALHLLGCPPFVFWGHYRGGIHISDLDPDEHLTVRLEGKYRPVHVHLAKYSEYPALCLYSVPNNRLEWQGLTTGSP